MSKNSTKRQSWGFISVLLVLLCLITIVCVGSSMPDQRHGPHHLALSDLSVVRTEAPPEEDGANYRFYTITFTLQNQGSEALDLEKYMFHYETKSSESYMAILDHSDNQALFDAPVLPCGASCQIQHTVRVYNRDKLSDIFPVTLTYDAYGNGVNLYTLTQDLFVTES